MRLNLNGVWDFYPNGGDERFDIVVPTWWDSLSRTTGYPEEWEKGLRHGVYVKTVDLPENVTDEDVFLHVGALATLGKVFVNGKSVGPTTTKGYLMTLLPYDLDINDVVKPGANEIRIEVWSVKALPEDALATEGGPDRLLFPFGVEHRRPCRHRRRRGNRHQAEAQDRRSADHAGPEEERRPEHDELAVNVTIVNHAEADADLLLGAAVHQAKGVTSTAALDFGKTSVHAPAGKETVVRLAKGWPTAHYWSRTDPFLYTVDAAIADAASGETVNEASDRFGFRQFWREGDKYIFNGVKIRLRGDSLCLLNQATAI